MPNVNTEWPIDILAVRSFISFHSDLYLADCFCSLRQAHYGVRVVFLIFLYSVHCSRYFKYFLMCPLHYSRVRWCEFEATELAQTYRILNNFFAASHSQRNSKL